MRPSKLVLVLRDRPRNTFSHLLDRRLISSIEREKEKKNMSMNRIPGDKDIYIGR